jgi:nicotinamidase-related amidase
MSTALVLIDVQQSMFEPDPVHDARAILERILGLLAAAREAGAPVCFIQHAGHPGGQTEHGTDGWALHPSLAPRTGEVVIEKTTPDAFYQTTLDGALAQRGVTRLVIAGMLTELGVDATARVAFDRGYEVVVAADAHSTTDGVVAATEIIAHHNATLSSLARVTPSAEISFDPLPALVDDPLLTPIDQAAIRAGLAEWDTYARWLTTGDAKPFWPFTHPGRAADALRLLWDSAFKPHGQYVAPPRWEVGMARQFIAPLKSIPMAFRRTCVESVAKAMDHLLQNPRNPLAPQLRDLGNRLWSYDSRDLRLIYIPETVVDRDGRERHIVFLIYVAPGVPVKNPFA